MNIRLLRNFSFFLLTTLLFACGSNVENNNGQNNNTDNNQTNNQVDGGTLDFNQFIEKNILANSNKGSLQYLKDYIDPQYGLTVIYRPGVGSTVDFYKQVGEFKDNADEFPLNLLKSMSCKSALAKGIPAFSCAGDGFNKKGCFWDDFSGDLPDGNEIADALNEMAEVSGVPPTQDQINKADICFEFATYVFVHTDLGLELRFGLKDGKFVLVVVNAAKYDCAA